MVEGATAGNLLADSIKQAVAFAKDWTNVIADLRGRFAGYLHDVASKNKETAAEYLKDLKEANDRAIEYGPPLPAATPVR